MKNTASLQSATDNQALLEEKIKDIQAIVKMLNIWVKDNNYELSPVVNILNDKVEMLLDIVKIK